MTATDRAPRRFLGAQTVPPWCGDLDWREPGCYDVRQQAPGEDWVRVVVWPVDDPVTEFSYDVPSPLPAPGDPVPQTTLQLTVEVLTQASKNRVRVMIRPLDDSTNGVLSWYYYSRKHPVPTPARGVDELTHSTEMCVREIANTPYDGRPVATSFARLFAVSARKGLRPLTDAVTVMTRNERRTHELQPDP